MSATSAHETGVPVTALCPPIEALLLCPSETNLWQEAKDTSRAEALHSDLQVSPRRFEAHPFPRDAFMSKRRFVVAPDRLGDALEMKGTVLI